jgi:predicted NUDIX family NTP pyrophosphohydrolase
VDRCAWFSPAQALVYLNPAQSEFVPRLEALLAGR